MLKGLSYGAIGLLVIIQKQYGDTANATLRERPFVLKDVLNPGESAQSTKRLLRELVNEGYLSSGQGRQAKTGYFSFPQYRLINPLPIAFMDDVATESVVVS